MLPGTPWSTTSTTGHHFPLTRTDTSPPHFKTFSTERGPKHLFPGESHLRIIITGNAKPSSICLTCGQSPGRSMSCMTASLIQRRLSMSQPSLATLGCWPGCLANSPPGRMWQLTPGYAAPTLCWRREGAGLSITRSCHMSGLQLIIHLPLNPFFLQRIIHVKTWTLEWTWIHLFQTLVQF